MEYILVRVYGNGQHMNKVYPVYYKWLSQAEAQCNRLNAANDNSHEDKWILMPITEYEGKVWEC